MQFPKQVTKRRKRKKMNRSFKKLLTLIYLHSNIEIYLTPYAISFDKVSWFLISHRLSRKLSKLLNLEVKKVISDFYEV